MRASVLVFRSYCPCVGVHIAFLRIIVSLGAVRVGGMAWCHIGAIFSRVTAYGVAARVHMTTS